MTSLRAHSGTTLVELLIFLTILGSVVGLILPVFFQSAESSVRQRGVAVVEENGAQILQNVRLSIANAERILSPAIGFSGSLIALQTGSGGTNPTIIGSSGGILYVVEHAVKRRITSPQVAVTDFVARNTSTSATRQSAAVSFRVTHVIPLREPETYMEYFDTAVSLLPADIPTGAVCGCAAPTCNPANMYNWQVCDNGVCTAASTNLKCPY